MAKYRYFGNKIIKKQRESLFDKARQITLPGFQKIPLYDVGVFFFKGPQKGSITTRASAIAFNFFLAIFPALIFLFTLIPYIPVQNFQNELLSLLQDFMPENAYDTAETTIKDIALNKRGGLLSVGFISAMFFATNGFVAMIRAFNASANSFETRSGFQQRMISLLLVFIIFTLLTLAVILMVAGRIALKTMVKLNLMEQDFTYYLLISGRWIVVIALFFFAISFLYYLSPAKKSRWTFISPGSTLATIMMVLISIVFSFFVNNFGSYNKLYGSLGTLVVILLWIYLNALSLLIGFELSASIYAGRINFHSVNHEEAL